MIWPFPERVTSGRCWLLLLALLGVTAAASGALADTRALVTQGQTAFQNGAFSQAAADWQKAVESFRRQGNTNEEIATSISLASAYQSIGQQRRAVQVLEGALLLAEKAGDRSRVTLVRSKLGAALLLTLETERAASLLSEALAAARADTDSLLAAAILNDLGNLLATQQKTSEALTAYEESAALARQTSNSRLRWSVLFLQRQIAGYPSRWRSGRVRFRRHQQAANNRRLEPSY